MKKIIPFVVTSMIIFSGCGSNNNSSKKESSSKENQTSTNSSVVSSSSKGQITSSSSPIVSKNNLTGTFGREYAPYYEEGVPLIEDSYVVYMNFDGFARYYFDAYQFL